MTRKLSFFLLFIFVYLQYFLWFGKNNLLTSLEVQKVLVELQAENDELKLQNDRLFAETSDLYDGLEAIEERARTGLGMIKPDEHFYRLIVEQEQK